VPYQLHQMFCRPLLHQLQSGVLQYSVLGPLLFIIYVDGVESVTLLDSTVFMITFSDNMVLYRLIFSHEGYLLLQRDIDAILAG